MKNPHISYFIAANRVKNMGKGISGDVVRVLGEATTSCASGKGATEESTGLGRGLYCQLPEP